MMNVKVTRYENPKAVGWAGYIEPADKSWIAYVALNGKPLFFLSRDTETGAVLPDDPAEREAHLRMLREERARQEGGLRIGMPNDGSAIFPEGMSDPHKIGEAIHPLGIHGGERPA